MGLILALLASGGVLYGDEVWLNNGHQLTGKILSLDSEQLILEVPEGKLTLRRSLIDHLVRIPARDSMLAECQRRLEGGFPGSALPYLRREYRRQPGDQELLVLYRNCIVGETRRIIQEKAPGEALPLWTELCALPGQHPDFEELRALVIQKKDRLRDLEFNIYQAVEMCQPNHALEAIHILLEEFPTEESLWSSTISEQTLISATEAMSSEDYPLLSQRINQLITRDPGHWEKVRHALVYASTMGHGISLEDALTISPLSPALHLALANRASKFNSPLDMRIHLESVQNLVGAEIDVAQIRSQLRSRAWLELHGQHVPRDGIDVLCRQWLDHFWSKFGFPGRPPAIPEILEYSSLEELENHLGSSCGPARLETVQEYGSFQKSVLHVVPSDPFIDQNGIPRELFRSLVDSLLGVPRCPPWLEEGLCSMARGPLARSRDLWLLEDALRKGHLPSVQSLLEKDTCFENELLRAACGSLVDHLLGTTPTALLPLYLQQIRDEGLEPFLRSTTEIDTLHQLQQRWIGDLQTRRE